MIELPSQGETFKIKRMPGITFGHESLEAFALSYLECLIKEVQLLNEGQRTAETFERQIMVVDGFPGAGKTWVIEKIVPLIQYYVGRLANSAQPLSFKKLNWEDDAEGVGRIAQAAERITTPPDQLLGDEEIPKANCNLEKATARAIEDNQAIFLEVPVNSATLLKGKWIGRPLGSSVVYNMIHKAGDFANLPPFRVHKASVIGGPILRYVMVPFRDDNRNAKDLEKARKIAILYGKIPPETVEEWERSKNGANDLQVRKLESFGDAVSIRLQEEGKIAIPIEGFGSLAALLQSEVVDYAVDPVEAALNNQIYRAISVARVTDFNAREVFNLDPAFGCIVFNDPSFADLKITNPKLLREHLIARRGYQVHSQITP